MEKVRCIGCGKEYWSPGADWQHRACVVEVKEGPSQKQRKQRWDREKYNAYMKAYMKARRAKK